MNGDISYKKNKQSKCATNNAILPANITGVTGFESIQCHSESTIGDK